MNSGMWPFPTIILDSSVSLSSTFVSSVQDRHSFL